MADEKETNPVAGANTDKPRRRHPEKKKYDERYVNWYDRMSLPYQMAMQFGAVGIMMVVFFVQFRENSSENRAAREMYRDDLAATRATADKMILASTISREAADKRVDLIVQEIGKLVHRIDKVSDAMVEVSHQLQRTTDAVRGAGVELKKAADKMEEGMGIIPPPRVKSTAIPPTAPGGLP